MSLKYRPEIDGLRTIAVLPVVFFHAGFAGFSGGYVGVDIFFVISGFLITTILLREAENGGISLIRFYERRARRILPALFLVILASVPLAWFIMYPSQMEGFAQSTLAVLFFVSNIFFWREDDYFGPNAKELPLLHTWSLSVEEQFYILFPLLLILCFWLGRRYVLPMIVAGTVASFVLCVWAQSNPTISVAASFYLLPTRAWELGFGSLCSYYLLKHPQIGRGTITGDVLPAVGLGMIAWSIVMFNEATPMPSAHTLVPTGGAALIILSCCAGGIVYRLLTLSLMVWVGLLSYSLYLWHQPIFAFARIAIYGEPEVWHYGALITLAMVLAYGTWRFIETPVRDRTKFSGGVLSLVLGATFSTLLVFGAAEWKFSLLERLVFSDERYSNVEFPERDAQRFTCMSHFSRMLPLDEVCQHADGTDLVAVFGNSHAEGYAVTLAEQLSGTGKGVIEYTASACRFSYGLPFEQVLRPRCFNWFLEVTSELLRRSDITDIVIAFRWENQTVESLSALQKFVAEALLNEKRVIVVNQAPKQIDSIEYYIYNRLDKVGNAPGVLLADWRDTYKSVRAIMESFSEEVTVLEIDDIFCESVHCYAVRNSVALYHDDNHMSLQAVRRVSQRIADVILGDSAP